MPVDNLSKDFASGDLLLALMTQLSKNALIDINFDLQEELGGPADKKIELALQLTESFGIDRFLRVQDVISGNPKLIFTLMTEIFSASITNEMGVGKEVTADISSVNPAILLRPKGIALLQMVDFEPQFHFSQLRANAFIDFIELCVYIMEWTKEVQARHKLKVAMQ